MNKKLEEITFCETLDYEKLQENFNKFLESLRHYELSKFCEQVYLIFANIPKSLDPTWKNQELINFFSSKIPKLMEILYLKVLYWNKKNNLNILNLHYILKVIRILHNFVWINFNGSKIYFEEIQSIMESKLNNLNSKFDTITSNDDLKSKFWFIFSSTENSSILSRIINEFLFLLNRLKSYNSNEKIRKNFMNWCHITWFGIVVINIKKIDEKFLEELEQYLKFKNFTTSKLD